MRKLKTELECSKSCVLIIKDSFIRNMLVYFSVSAFMGLEIILAHAHILGLYEVLP